MNITANRQHITGNAGRIGAALGIALWAERHHCHHASVALALTDIPALVIPRDKPYEPPQAFRCAYGGTEGTCPACNWTGTIGGRKCGRFWRHRVPSDVLYWEPRDHPPQAIRPKLDSQSPVSGRGKSGGLRQFLTQFGLCGLSHWPVNN